VHALFVVNSPNFYATNATATIKLLLLLVLCSIISETIPESPEYCVSNCK